MPPDARCNGAGSLLLEEDLVHVGIREEGDGLAAGRPGVGGEGHRCVGVVGRALRLQVARRVARLEAALEAVAAEGAPLRLRIEKLGGVAGLAGGALRLED